MDPLIISIRLEFIEKQVKYLEVIKEKGKEELIRSFELSYALERTIQLISQAILDIAHHICAKERLGAPKTNNDAFRILANEGIIEENIEALQEMVTLRNRLVHVYEDTDPSLLFDYIPKMIKDSLNFGRSIALFVQSKQ